MARVANPPPPQRNFPWHTSPAPSNTMFPPSMPPGLCFSVPSEPRRAPHAPVSLPSPCARVQVVEILQLPEHLQDGDCGRQDDVRRCDRCGDPLMAGTYEAHMQTGCAPPPGPGQQRCPLCHQNLPAGDEAWQAHLLEPPGCPANPRHWSGRPSDREG